jgi:hypothetical protein
MTLPTPARNLVAVNLRYDAGAAALNARAVAQLLAKVLFSEGRNVSKAEAELSKSTSALFGLRRLAPSLVREGLQLLERQRLARESHGRWLLTKSGYDGILDDVTRATARTDSVLSRHFPKRIERAKLERWFQDACVAFYELYGAQWAASLGRKRAPKAITRESLASILESATARNDFVSERGVLETGFHEFLASQERDDIEHNWSLGQAMLAAQLVAANIGPDPLTARELHGTLLLLDTNALLVTALEEHRLAGHLNELGRALLEINACVGLNQRRREEYVAAVDNRRRDTRKVVEAFELPVLEGTGDEFLDTAIARGCRTVSDFEGFFDAVLDPPTELAEGVPIKEVDDPDVASLAERGAADTSLVDNIIATWATQRRRPKSRSAAQHDAALTSVAEGLRAKGQPCVVVTLDRTMYEVALRRAGPHDVPVWLTLDGLIQILAVDGAGPAIDPAEFAPLMASIIRHQVEPVLDTYTAADLAMVLEIEDRCAALPAEAARSIAVLVARARYAGRDRMDNELQLDVRRAFQGQKMDLAERLEESRADARSKDVQVRRAVTKAATASDLYIGAEVREIRRAVVRRAVVKGIWGIAAALILVIAALWLAGQTASMRKIPEFIQALLGFVAPAVAVVGWLARSVIPSARHEWLNAAITAQSQLDKQIAEKAEVDG